MTQRCNRTHHKAMRAWTRAILRYRTEGLSSKDACARARVPKPLRKLLIAATLHPNEELRAWSLPRSKRAELKRAKRDPGKAGAPAGKPTSIDQNLPRRIG